MEPAPPPSRGKLPRRVWIASIAAAACLIGAGVVWAAEPGAQPAASLTPSGPEPAPPSGKPGSSSTVSPAPGPRKVSACAAELVLTNTWEGGYQADVTVTALAALEDWEVKLKLGKSTVTGSWNSTLAVGAKGSVKAANVDFNGTVAEGGTAAFGFTAEGEAPKDFNVRCTSSAGDVPAGGEKADDEAGTPPAT